MRTQRDGNATEAGVYAAFATIGMLLSITAMTLAYCLLVYGISSLNPPGTALGTGNRTEIEHSTTEAPEHTKESQTPTPDQVRKIVICYIKHLEEGKGENNCPRRWARGTRQSIRIGLNGRQTQTSGQSTAQPTLSETTAPPEYQQTTERKDTSGRAITEGENNS